MHAFVTLQLPGLEGLHVRKAVKSTADIQVTLVKSQLKMLFDYLAKEGASCLGGNASSYSKSGRFAKAKA